ncbi:MAG: DinB family protein [Alphaproteobacteria bacterium]
MSPAQLVERMTRFIDAAVRLVKLMPDDRLDVEVPNRPRSYRALAHHMLRIPESFVEIADGAFFSEALPVAIPNPDDTAGTAALAAYGRSVRGKVETWWRETPDKSAQQTVQTYYGPQKLHEVLERSTWHIGQHTRQWMMLLDVEGVQFERPLGDSDFADLPMPKQVWDG